MHRGIFDYTTFINTALSVAATAKHIESSVQTELIQRNSIEMASKALKECYERFFKENDESKET